MGISKPVFTFIKTKAVHNVQRWVNKGSYSKVYKKTDDIIKRLLFSLFICFNLGQK